MMIKASLVFVLLLAACGLEPAEPPSTVHGPPSQPWVGTYISDTTNVQFRDSTHALVFTRLDLYGHPACQVIVRYDRLDGSDWLYGNTKGVCYYTVLGNAINLTATMHYTYPDSNYYENFEARYEVIEFWTKLKWYATPIILERVE